MLLYRKNPIFLGVLGIAVLAVLFLFSYFYFFPLIPIWYAAFVALPLPLFALRQGQKSPILMIGSGMIGGKILNLVARNHNNGYGIIHFRWDNPTSDSLEKEWARLNTIFEDDKIEKVVVALDDRRNQFPFDLLLAIRVTGVQIVEAVSFYEAISGRVPVEFLKPSDLIFCGGFKRSEGILMFKRGVDIFLSIVGLLLGLPLLLISAILIKLDSKGPVFYSQNRVGFKGRVFEVPKLRTMLDNAEGPSGPVYADKNDLRITRVGQFLRKYRIDEIPQMFTILSGAMSFVGPRPERPVFVEKLHGKIPFYNLRHTIKPGLTGWAQIRHPYSSTLKESHEKFEHDLYYIKHVSLFLDLKIIINTVRVLLLGQGAR